MSNDELTSLRAEINACDAEILASLSRRADAAYQIGQVKKEAGLPVYAPDREQIVIENVLKNNTSRFSGEYLQAIWREILAASRSLQQSEHVSYLGPEGTFSHQAVRLHFGSNVKCIAENRIGDVFRAVTHKQADFGVVPLENSSEGAVDETSDRLIESQLKIVGEIVLDVRQCLLSKTSLENITLVISHPQGLAQCRDWLAVNLPQASLREVASTALAVQRAAREDGVAAIGSETAAELYGAPILKRSVQDYIGNTTRFSIIARDNVNKPTGNDRTSIRFAVSNEAGSLYAALMPFRANNVNLSRIESRPSKSASWDYYFLVDLDGHEQDINVNLTLADLKQVASDLVILGSYPKARQPLAMLY